MSKQVIPAEFGGEGPRQILAEELKSADHFRAMMVIAIDENGEISLWANAMTPGDLGILMAKAQGYGLCVINGWDSE